MTRTPIHTEVYKGYTINIHQDEDVESPFENWDGLPDIWGAHRRYNFNTVKSEPSKNEAVIALPLYMYDHSGIVFSTTPFSCNWGDSGQYGYIYWTPAKIADLFGFTLPLSEGNRITLEEQLKSSVELLNDYIFGNVYGYDIVGTDEYCWGFFGDYDGKGNSLDSAREAVDYLDEAKFPLLKSLKGLKS